MSAVRYERIRFNGRTIILRNPTEVSLLGAKCLSGIEVDREGVEVAGRGADERRHIIDLAVITRRTSLGWNLKYGELEPSIRLTPKETNEHGR